MAVNVPYYGKGSKKISIFKALKPVSAKAFVYEPNKYHMARNKSQIHKT